MPTWDMKTVQDTVRTILDDGREKRPVTIPAGLPDDPVLREALEVAARLARLWGEPPDHLLVRLRGEPTREFCQQLAEVMRPARVHLTRVAEASSPHAVRQVNREAVYAHIVEPTILMDRLVALGEAFSVPLKVTLITTY